MKQTLTLADIDLKLSELQAELLKIERGKSVLPYLRTTGDPLHPWRTSHQDVADEINSVRRQIEAWERKKAELIANRGRQSASDGRRKPEHVIVKEVCKKILGEKGGTVEDVFDEAAEILGKTPDNVRRLYYYTPSTKKSKKAENK